MQGPTQAFLRKIEDPVMPGSPLPLLIRRSKLAVDEYRSELAGLIEEEAKAEAALERHDARLADEQARLTRCPPEAMMAYTGWLRRHQGERNRLMDLRSKLMRSREAAQDVLLEACAELKRLELADEARLKAEKLAQARKADAKAEEVAMISRHAGDLKAKRG
jgi:hypothetical protein